MADFSGLGKILVIRGTALFVVGLLFMFGDKIPFLGRLPGDIFIQRKGFNFYFPVVTCIVVSVLLTIILNIISRR
jgi:hypothetical protein